MDGINTRLHRYPYSLVWTPIPVLTWLFPLIGHIGICTSSGVIRDFAGPYHVGEDKMAFGNPTRYCQLDPALVEGIDWDTAISETAEVYNNRMHNLIFDNCHSMVALALNKMKYRGSNKWDMVGVAVIIFFLGKYNGISGVLKSLTPTIILYSIFIGVYLSVGLNS